MRSNTRLFLWLLVALGALSALKVAAGRWRAETANRRVELVLDWDEVRGLSDETGTPLRDVLRSFYDAGARGIAIGEDSIGEMQGLRRLEILPPAGPAPSGIPSEMLTRLRVPDAALRNRIASALLHKWGVHASVEGDVLTVRAAWQEMYGLTIGVAADVVSTVRAAHLEPVLRVSNFPTAGPSSVAWTVHTIRAAGGRLVIFGGDQVLGYPGSVKDAANAFEAENLLFGQVEFGKQKGEDELAKALKGNIIRVHSINPTEMSRMSVNDAVDRFLRAAEERNIRAMYIRMLPGAPQPLLLSNVQYVNGISQALDSHRLSIDRAVPFPPYESRPVERMLMGLGVAAATLLLVLYLWPAAGWTLVLVLALALLDVVLPVTHAGRQLVALQGAVLMPVLAFLVLRSRMEIRAGGIGSIADDESPAPPGQALPSHRERLLPAAVQRIPDFLLVSAISALGALFVVGLLSNRLGTVKLEEFRGIKAQQAGAILLVAAIFYLDISSRGGLAAARARIRRRLAEIWGQPMLLGGLIVFFVALGVLAFLLARSGNDPGVGVSPLELKFRTVLERLLRVRPRTKEFMIGHPALLLGIALLSLRRLRWALPVLIVGAIGQVSIVNTFCHLHTPLYVSLLRVVNGLWTGILVGILIAAVVDVVTRRSGPVPLADRVR